MSINEDENNEMNIQIAFTILEMNYDNICSITKRKLKHQYHKLALKYHPDKNGNTINSTQYFQKINRAYTYLLDENIFCKDNSGSGSDSDDNSNTDNSSDLEKDYTNNIDFLSSPTFYVSLLTMFLSNIFKNNLNYTEIIKTNIKELLMMGTKLTKTGVLDLFKNIKKENTIEIYSFLCKYKETLHISNYIIELVSSVIKDKYKDDLIFILTPSIDDILDNNLYKLIVDDQAYLVPLWHNELYFDLAKDNSNKEIIVFCNPILPDELTIEDSNIYYNLLVQFDKGLMENTHLHFTIGNRSFKIPIYELKIKRTQYYTFKNAGISKIIENDIYNVNYHGDLIVKICLS